MKLEIKKSCRDGTTARIPFGCLNYTFDSSVLNNLSLINDITISPAGIAFVKRHMRYGILPQMLDEILNTRVMVKQSMKAYKNDPVQQRWHSMVKTIMRLQWLYSTLDARQLGLKLIANVTYGYTSAAFSGRMPCVEIADSIVHKGRETLERAIALIHARKEWRARVIYGDTDRQEFSIKSRQITLLFSLFIQLAGRTRAEAFALAKEMCDTVTADNPHPVKLKFEKVYQPCVLLTKKHYVGYAWETPEQEKPTFDAKGIETVRRDTCPLVTKVMEKSTSCAI